MFKGGQMKTKLLIVMMALAVTAALAQGRRGRGPGPGYDPKTETTISGTIDQINQQDSFCPGGGTHLVVKTDKGSMEVRLGPTKFIEDQKFELKKGDTVQVIGSKLDSKAGEFLIARQVTSGGKTLTLRNEKGFPAWPRGVCR